MKRAFFLSPMIVAFAVSVLLLSSCATVKYGSDAYDVSAQHLRIAIVPIEYEHTFPSSKNVSKMKQEEANRIERQELYELMHKMLAKRLKGKGVELQQAVETAQVYYSTERHEELTNIELCALLHVDAIVKYKVLKTEFRTAGESYFQGRYHGDQYVPASKFDVDVEARLHDSRAENAIYFYSHESIGSMTSNIEKHTKRLVRKSIKKLPYE